MSNTYRGMIEEMIKKIESVYTDAEWMRDYATEEEKIYWNQIRKTFYDAANPLKTLDNKLSISRGNMELD